MLKNYKTMVIPLLLIIIFAGVFYFNSREPAAQEAQLFYESAKKYSSASFQNKDKNNDAISNSRRNIITETVKKVSKAVVGINVIEIREQQYRSPFGFFDDPFFKHFFGDRTYRQKIKELGSGFIISPDGYIVTNDHVAGNASKITVTLTSGEEYEAKVVGTDRASDICLLKVDAKNLPYQILGNSDDIIIGEWVIALGNPFGLFQVNDRPTVTVGVVSSTGMNLEPLNNRYYLNMIQTDAAINGGNSGGPLVNSIGEVIGMNTLIFTAGNGKGSIGLGFAIPINKVKQIVSELKKFGNINRNFQIGFRIQSIDEGIANYYNLGLSKGVIITEVFSGSPAEKGGLKPGDIILKVNDYNIDDAKTLEGVFQEFRPGDTITLTLLRENKQIKREMTLEGITN